MGNFKYFEKDGITYLSVGEGRIKTRWNSRWVPSSESITVLPTSITLSETEYTIKVEGTYILTATISPETTTTKTVVWSSSNEEVATVSTSGEITGVGVGECKIIATSSADSSVKAECALTVEAKE